MRFFWVWGVFCDIFSGCDGCGLFLCLFFFLFVLDDFPRGSLVSLCFHLLVCVHFLFVAFCMGFF